MPIAAAKSKKLRRSTAGTSLAAPTLGGLRQAELTRIIRAMKSAGLTVGEIEVSGGKIRVLANSTPRVETSSGYLTIAEACAYGKFGRSRAFELIAAGELTTKKSGKVTLIKKTSIDRWLAKLPGGKRR